VGKNVRRVVTFGCQGIKLAGTLDDGPSTNALLIVSGGNEIRVGAHRGMAELAQTIAARGHPVFRFDRRGIGDSDGQNGGFENSGPDIAAALETLRTACPWIKNVVAFGNCDAATALMLHCPGVDHLVLANPWVSEPTDDLPPPAAIRDRYARRLRDPRAWLALLTGKINIHSTIRGLSRISQSKTEPHGLADRVSIALANDNRPTTILLATGDNTAIAFADSWKSASFERARRRSNVATIFMNSESHSFASDADFSILVESLATALAQ
jgi:exosortase A-associated hydrolase 1